MVRYRVIRASTSTVSIKAMSQHVKRFIDDLDVNPFWASNTSMNAGTNLDGKHQYSDATGITCVHTSTPVRFIKVDVWITTGSPNVLLAPRVAARNQKCHPSRAENDKHTARRQGLGLKQINLGEKCTHVITRCHRPRHHIYNNMLGVGKLVVFHKFELRQPTHDPYGVRLIVLWIAQRVLKILERAVATPHAICGEDIRRNNVELGIAESCQDPDTPINRGSDRKHMSM